MVKKVIFFVIGIISLLVIFPVPIKAQCPNNYGCGFCLIPATCGNTGVCDNTCYYGKTIIGCQSYQCRFCFKDPNKPSCGPSVSGTTCYYGGSPQCVYGGWSCSYSSSCSICSGKLIGSCTSSGCTNFNKCGSACGASAECDGIAPKTNYCSSGYSIQCDSNCELTKTNCESCSESGDGGETDYLVRGTVTASYCSGATGQCSSYSYSDVCAADLDPSKDPQGVFLMEAICDPITMFPQGSKAYDSDIDCSKRTDGNTKCISGRGMCGCLYDADCPVKDNRKGFCDTTTYRCKWDNCASNSDCDTGYCCEKVVGTITTAKGCVPKGTIKDSKYLCDPPEWNSTSTESKKSTNIFELIWNTLSGLIKF